MKDKRFSWKIYKLHTLYLTNFSCIMVVSFFLVEKVTGVSRENTWQIS